jgi:hypothetical protein
MRDDLKGRRRDRANAEARWRYVVKHEPKPVMAVAHEMLKDAAKRRWPWARLLKEAEIVVRMFVSRRQ